MAERQTRWRSKVRAKHSRQLQGCPSRNGPRMLSGHERGRKKGSKVATVDDNARISSLFAQPHPNRKVLSRTMSHQRQTVCGRGVVSHPRLVKHVNDQFVDQAPIAPLLSPSKVTASPVCNPGCFCMTRRRNSCSPQTTEGNIESQGLHTYIVNILVVAESNSE